MNKKITIKQYIERDFGGSTAKFARAMGICFDTAANLRDGKTVPRKLAMRRLLARDNVKFERLTYKSKRA
jgi:hypothetical protein